MIPEQNQYPQSIFDEYSEVCCSSIFYTLYTLPDGRIAPCCDNPQPIIYGDVNHMTLVEAWNGTVRRNFLVQHLKKEKNKNLICKQCINPITSNFKEDSLTGYEEKLLDRIEEDYKNRKWVFSGPPKWTASAT
jgi:hypothetical protein